MSWVLWFMSHFECISSRIYIYIYIYYISFFYVWWRDSSKVFWKLTRKILNQSCNGNTKKFYRLNSFCSCLWVIVRSSGLFRKYPTQSFCAGGSVCTEKSNKTQKSYWFPGTSTTLYNCPSVWGTTSNSFSWLKTWLHYPHSYTDRLDDEIIYI